MTQDEARDQNVKDRQKGDYGVLVEFSVEDVSARIELARQFVDEMRRLLDTGP